LNEWVDVKVYDRIIRGYVIDEAELQYLVRKVLRFHPDGSIDRESGKQWFYKSSVVILDDALHEEDAKELIDLAIDMRDITWAKQLSR
jgi:hypothetical protein